jgi:porphobilinogen synthase
LEAAGFVDRALVSYAVKYASAFSGPFREAAGSTPQSGDRRGYQMDPPNVREAVHERVDVSLVAYQVSGEFAMMHAAAQRGWLDLDRAMLETAISLRRAGAGILITYFARPLAIALRAAA